MYIPRKNSNNFNVFYMGTDPNIPKPGKYILELRKNGLQLKEAFSKRGFIEAKQMASTTVGYEVVSRGLSPGGAIAGGILAGGIGAVAGASVGSKKVEPHVALMYKDASGNEHQLVFVTKLAEKLKKNLDKRYKLTI